MERAAASIGYSQNACCSTREVVMDLSVTENSNAGGWGRGINGECSTVNTKLCVVLEIHQI